MKIGGGTPAKMPNIISLDSKELPDIANWKPGQRYRIVLEVEQTGFSMGGYDANDNTSRASFRVISAKPQYGSGPVRQASNGKPDKSATMSALQRKAAQS